MTNIACKSDDSIKVNAFLEHYVSRCKCYVLINMENQEAARVYVLENAPLTEIPKDVLTVQHNGNFVFAGRENLILQPYRDEITRSEALALHACNLKFAPRWYLVIDDTDGDNRYVDRIYVFPKFSIRNTYLFDAPYNVWDNLGKALSEPHYATIECIIRHNGYESEWTGNVLVREAPKALNVSASESEDFEVIDHENKPEKGIDPPREVLCHAADADVMKAADVPNPELPNCDQLINYYTGWIARAKSALVYKNFEISTQTYRLDMANAQIENLEGELESYQQKCEKAEKEVHKLTFDCHEAEKYLGFAHDKIEDLKAECKSYQQKCEKAEKESHEIIHRCYDAETRLDMANDEIKGLKADCDSYRTQAKTLKCQLDAAIDEIKDLAADRDSYRTRLDEEKKANEVVHLCVSKIQDLFDAHKEKHYALKDECERLKSESAAFRAAIELLIQENQLLKKSSEDTEKMRDIIKKLSNIVAAEVE